MRILKVWDSEYPWDVRVEKICKALTASGHDVHIAARNRAGAQIHERLPEGEVQRIASWPRSGSRLDAAFQFPFPVSPRWWSHVRRSAEACQTEVIIVRDLLLAPIAINVARGLGIPVILDMAEHYPAMMQDLWISGKAKARDFLVRNPRAVKCVEDWSLSRVDHVIVVVEESKARVAACGVPEDRISIVGNTPPKSRLRDFQVFRARKREAARLSAGPLPFRLVYLGLMEEVRGVRTVIDAVAATRSAGIPVTLDLIGDGHSLSDFRRRAADLGLEGKAVRLHGFLPYRDALEVVATADVGVIPHFDTESWRSTIPNKLFDYMSLGLPVIASNVRPVERILSETGAGITFRDRDPGDLSQVITRVHEDANRLGMGDKGVRAIEGRYHFERDAEELNRALELVRSRGTKP